MTSLRTLRNSPHEFWSITKFCKHLSVLWFWCDCATISFSVTARAVAWSLARHFEEMPFVLERVYCSALETNRKWYVYSGKFSCSQVVTGFTKELRRVEVENSNRVPRSPRIFTLKFLYVFLLGIFQAARPRSSGRELVPCAAFAMNFRFEFFVRVSTGIFQAQDPQVGNSYRVSRLVYAPKISVFVTC